MTSKLLKTTTALSLSLAVVGGTQAQAETGLSIDIEAQNMVDAVAQLGETAGIQIIGPNELLNGKVSQPISGVSDPMRALELMLNDPALKVSDLSDGTLIVAPVDEGYVVSQNAQNDEPFVLPPIIFETDRSARPINEIPRAVKNVDQVELRKTLNKTTNFSAGLSELIPGFSPPVFQNATRGLTLRGREPLYLLDGIPLSNGQFGVTLQFIDPQVIENIEVLYGPTALYGSGAAGGVIQFFTKDPTEDRQLRFSTGVSTSLARGSEFDGDSFSYRVAGEARGSVDRFGYVAVASYESNGAQFQPDGQRIAPTRLDDFDDVSLFGKLTYDIGESSRIEGLINYTRSEAVDTDFMGSLTSVTGDRSSVAIFAPTSYANQPRQEATYLSFGYYNEDLLGADFSVQVYYSNEEVIQIGADISALPLPPTFPDFFQTNGEEEGYGLRSDLRFDVTDAFEVNVGLDYRKEEDLSLLQISTAAGGAPGFFDGAIIRDQDPPLELETFGFFAQGAYEVTPSLTINGGVRYDYFEYDIGVSNPVFVPVPGIRPGGSGSNDGFSYNIGAIYDINDTTSVFASFAQGFSIPNIQLNSRFVAPGVPVSGSNLVDPIVVDSYEIGIRGLAYTTEYAFAAFYAESDLGESAQIDPATGFGQVVRAPQRNYGFEFATRTAVTSQLDISTAIAWNDGENDVNNDGAYLALSSLSVLPLSVRVRADYQVTPQLALNGSLQYLASRSDAFQDGVDNQSSEEYLTVDIGLTYDLPQDRGQLSLQVTNLFNEFYLPLESTTRTGPTSNRRFAAPGRELVVNYSVSF